MLKRFIEVNICVFVFLLCIYLGTILGSKLYTCFAGIVLILGILIMILEDLYTKCRSKHSDNQANIYRKFRVKCFYLQCKKKA